MKNISFFLFLAIGIALGMHSCKSSNNNKTVNRKHKGEEEFNKYLELKKSKFKNKPVPNRIVYGIDGQQYQLADLKGKVVLLNFWFTACKPCITEIPSLNELQSKFGKKLVVLSLSTDSKSVATKTAKEKNMNYVVGHDGKSFAAQLEVTSYPTTFLIDQKGVVREVFIGADAFDATQTYREIKPHVEKLL